MPIKLKSNMFLSLIGLVPRACQRAILPSLCTRPTDDYVVQEVRAEGNPHVDVDDVVHILHEQQESILRLQ